MRVLAPRAHVFVEDRRFLEPVRPSTVVVNHPTIINETVNITNLKVVNHTVMNEAPHTQVIEQVSGRTIQPVPVRNESDPRGNYPQLHAERRSNEPKVEAQKQSPKNARELEEKAAQADPVRRGKDVAAKVHEESQRNSIGQEKNAPQVSKFANRSG